MYDCIARIVMSRTECNAVCTVIFLVVNCYDMDKKVLDFGDLDPMFKVIGGLKMLANGLSALYTQKE